MDLKISLRNNIDFVAGFVVGFVAPMCAENVAKGQWRMGGDIGAWINICADGI